MDKLSKKHQKQVKFWHWITIFLVILSLISGGFLLYRWWQINYLHQLRKNNEGLKQEIDQLKSKQQKQQAEAHQIYQKQQKQLSQISNLAKNPNIQEFFNDFLQGYAYRFAEKQNLAEYCLPLKFGGFYQQKQAKSHKFQELGQATFDLDTQQTVIRLNQCYLLNKLGYERYFATLNHYLDISFVALTETISHELAHYFQFIKYEQSSCESSGQKDASGNFLAPELVKEHTQFTAEIKKMIVDSEEYPTLEKYWKMINVNY